MLKTINIHCYHKIGVVFCYFIIVIIIVVTRMSYVSSILMFVYFIDVFIFWFFQKFGAVVLSTNDKCKK